MKLRAQLAKAIQETRKAHGWHNRTEFAAKVNASEDVIYNRESGRTLLTLIDVIDYAKVLGLRPDQYVKELVERCELNDWREIAQQLDCTVAIAKKRLKIAQGDLRMTRDQVWEMYIQGQIKL